ncbi:MAG: ATP synthase F1 subunit epsilon [Anaerolineae bacterium]|nr:ATP synthase F1 subunit epsilon [Anaerolineae bacterium]
MPFTCEIITQERLVFKESGIVSVTAQGAEGELTILSRHTPLITTLDYGEVRVRKENAEEVFAIGGGILQVAENHMVILADSAERSDEIDIERAEEARRRAREIMEEGAPADPAAVAALEAAIKRADIRMKVARQRRQQRGSGIDEQTTQ